MYLFFCSCTWGLVTIYKHTLYLSLLFMIDVCFSFTYPFMCCLFSPFIHMLLITCMQSIYFCFTQRCLDEFCFKVFQKYRLSKFTCHKLSSCKVFQEFMIGWILLYSISEYELSDLWLLSYAHLFVVVLSWIAKVGDC